MNTYSEMTIVISQKEVLKKETSRLFAILDLFTEEELTRFKKFLDSPFFNNDQLLRQLYQKIRPKKSLPTKHIQGKTLLKIFKGANEERGLEKLKEKIMGLSKLGMECLAHLEVQYDDLSKKKILTSTLKKRNNTILFQEAIHDYQRKLDMEPITIMRLMDSWWLKHQQYFHQYTEQLRPNIESFKKTNNLFEIFIQLVKLRYFAEVINRKNIIKEKFELDDLESLLKKIKGKEIKEPLIFLYTELLELLNIDFNPSKYLTYKKQLEEHLSSFAKVDQLVFIKLTFNTLFRAYDRGYVEFIQDQLNWAKTGLEKKVYEFENTISDDEYLNIAITALLAKDFSFFNNFIEKYKDYLEPKFKVKAYLLAKAFGHFHKEEFQLSIALVSDDHFKQKKDELKYTLRVKTLVLRCYLEIFLKTWKEYEAFLAAKDNLRQFIKRHEGEFSTRHRKGYKKFLFFCMKLYSYKNQFRTSKEDKEKLLKQLAEAKYVMARPWLEKKIIMLK